MYWHLRPGGKTQVTIEYIDGVPARVDSVIVSAQHSPDVDNVYYIIYNSK